jgi:small subunit ribosomal protein S19
MSRSLWKGLFIDPKLLKNKKQKANSKIWSRSSAIPSSLIGETVFVHNGKEFKRVSITREKIGFKFGEFSFTRRYTLKQKTQNSAK